MGPGRQCPPPRPAHRRRGRRRRAAPGRGGADRPPVPPPRLRGPARGGRAHADPALPRHQPPGHRRRRTPACGPRRPAASTRHPSGAAAASRSRPTWRRPPWPWWPSSLRPGDYDALLERYRAASTPQEEMRSLNALSAFPDIDLALRTFDLAMTEVRSQNGWIVIAALLANPVAGQAVWGRITESWDAILDRFPKNAQSRIAEAIPALCGDAGFAATVVQFLTDHPLASGPRRVAQSVERLGVNVAFADRERDAAGRQPGRRRRRRHGVSTETDGAPAHADPVSGPSRTIGAGDRPGCRPSSGRPGRPGASCPTTRARPCCTPPCGPARRCFPGRRRRPSWRSAPGAASRRCTWGRRPRRPAPSCSPSTTTAAPRRTSPAGSTTRPIWSTPIWVRSTPWPTGGGPSATPPSKDRWWASWATPPPWPHAGRTRWRSASSTAATARSRPGPTSGAGRPGSSSAAGWPSTTSSPTPPTVAGRPMSSSAPPWPPASSPRTAPAGACACCAGSAPPAR